jgi:hypothetical protein
MSDEKQDVVRAIIAEMREAYHPERPPCYELCEGPIDPWFGCRRIPQTLLTLADRLDAAYDQKLKEIADVVSQLDGRDLVCDTDLSRKLDALLSPYTSAQKAGEIEQRAPGDAQKTGEIEQ